MKVLAFGLGLGAGIQAFRAWPPDAPVGMESAVVCFIVGLIAAYVAGRARRPAGGIAVATAEATATASNTVQLAVVVPGQGAGQVGAHGGISVPTESAPWLGAVHSAPSLDQLDGADMRDVMEQLGEVDYEENS
jgi:hypothetical protein